MHYFYGKSNQGHGICPLYRGCLPLGESVIRGFTVYSAVNAIMRLLQFLCASGVDFILLYSLVKKAIKKKLEERKAGPSSSGSAAKSVSKQPRHHPLQQAASQLWQRVLPAPLPQARNSQLIKRYNYRIVCAIVKFNTYHLFSRNQCLSR